AISFGLFSAAARCCLSSDSVITTPKSFTTEHRGTEKFCKANRLVLGVRCLALDIRCAFNHCVPDLSRIGVFQLHNFQISQLPNSLCLCDSVVKKSIHLHFLHPLRHPHIPAEFLGHGVA